VVEVGREVFVLVVVVVFLVVVVVVFLVVVVVTVVPLHTPNSD